MLNPKAPKFNASGQGSESAWQKESTSQWITKVNQVEETATIGKQN